jgi:hypothetical protein
MGSGRTSFWANWEFFHDENEGFAGGTFPQFSINNPDHSVRRGITPPGASLVMPVEFSKKLGSVPINWEVGYNAVHLGPDGSNSNEFYGPGAFDHSNNQETLGIGARYKLRPAFILL